MNITRHTCLAALLLLAACDSNSMKSTLGMGQKAPDEFVVVSRPPLVMPPEFDLQPPQPGAEPPHIPSTEAQARKLLLGTRDDTMTLDEFLDTPDNTPAVDTAVTPVIVGDAPTAASANFLNKLGADTANPSIRTQLRQDIAAPPPEATEEAGSLYEQMMGEAREEPVVDPAAEAERLRTNKDAGKSVTDGETPTQDNSSKSVLDRFF